MRNDPEFSTGDKPVSEPEIIPPPRKGTQSRFDRDMWMSPERQGAHRIYVTRLGPFGVFSLIFGVFLFAAFVLILLAGAVLLWIPIAAVLVAAAIIGPLLRKSFRHLR